MPLSRITPPSRIPTSAQPTALLQAISPAVLDPGSSVPADTAPGPAAAVDPPTPTAAMLASTRPVPSATAGYFRIHHVRFRTSGVEGGALAGNREVSLSPSELDSKRVVFMFPNAIKTGDRATDPVSGSLYAALISTVLTLDTSRLPASLTPLSTPPAQSVPWFHWLHCSAISAFYWNPQMAPPSSSQNSFSSQIPPSKG